MPLHKSSVIFLGIIFAFLAVKAVDGFVENHDKAIHQQEDLGRQAFEQLNERQKEAFKVYVPCIGESLAKRDHHRVNELIAHLELELRLTVLERKLL